MSARFLAALPFFTATLMLASGGAPFFWPLGLAVVAALSVLLAWRVSLTTFAALLWMVAAAAVPIFWVRSTTTEPSLGLSAALLVTSIAVVRLFFRAALFGRSFDRALWLMTAVAAGIGAKSAAYLYLSALFAASVLVDAAGGLSALRAAARAPRATASVVVLSGVVTALLVLALPALDRATNRQFQAFFSGGLRRTGFTPQMRLDASGLITTSDDVVLRVSGAKADYLRGAVFDVFDGRFWSASKRGPVVSGGGVKEGARTEVEAAERSRWLFAPRGSRIVGDTAWEADPLGALHPLEPRGVSSWAFAPVAEAPDPPGAADLGVPPALVPKLKALAQEWTAGAVGDRERANAIARHLQTDFRYTLERRPVRAGQLELLDFLFVHREGHCEFFASAFVVLARVSDIPARLVAGFRVVEHNGFGDYAVVRAKHAHAWAEAYVGAPAGRFEVFDPTPSGVVSLAETRPRTVYAFLDYLWTAAGAAYRAAAAAPERTIPVLGSLAVIAFIIRAIGNRRRKGSDPGDALDAPPAAFLAFEARLAERGLVRDRAETLEAFTERLVLAEHDAPAQALRRYVRARYGPGKSSEDELAALLDVTMRPS